MRNLFKTYFFLIIALFFLTDCSNLNEEVEKKLNELKNKITSFLYMYSSMHLSVR